MSRGAVALIGSIVLFLAGSKAMTSAARNSTSVLGPRPNSKLEPVRS
jgi:hypothetical protein